MTPTERTDASVTIASRFHGPEGTGNGGYACSVVAGFVGDCAQVILHAPPAVDLDTAVRAATDPTTITWHPFPTCFVCGPRRAAGDGLRIFPGLVSDRLLAAPWTPTRDLAAGDGLVAAEYLWAALDCPGGWATMLLVPPGTVSVLGTLTGIVHVRPEPETTCIVVSQPDRVDGRKAYAAAGVYTADAHLLAAAAATWIIIRGHASDPQADATVP